MLNKHQTKALDPCLKHQNVYRMSSVTKPYCKLCQLAKINLFNKYMMVLQQKQLSRPVKSFQKCMYHKIPFKCSFVPIMLSNTEFVYPIYL